MTRVNIYDLKTHLSMHMQRVQAGETIVVCKRNVPIAEIRPIAPWLTEMRPIGLASGRFEVPDDFNEPLDEATLGGFEGAGA